MISLRFLFAEMCLMLAGFGLAVSLRPTRPTTRVEMAGLSLLLGPGVVSLALFVLGSFLQGAALICAVAGLCIALGVIGFARSRSIAFSSPEIDCWWPLAIPLLAAIGWQAGIHPLSADGLFNFELRAQLATLHGGGVPTELFSDPSRIWAHPGYPLFLPLTQAWVYLCVGLPHQGLGQLLALHFAAGAMSLLHAGVTRLTGDAWRGLLAVALLFLLPAATLVPGSASSLWADFPLAAIFLGAVLYLVEFAGGGGTLALFSASLALLPWVKREGFILAAVLVVAFAWIAWRSKRAVLILPALLPLAATSVGWAAFLRMVHASADRDFLPVTFDAIAAHLPRLSFILLGMGREMLAVERWNVLWPLVVMAAWRVARERSLSRWRLLLPIVAALLALYSGIYLLSAWPSLPLHLVTSLPRLLLPVAMPALLLIVAVVPSWHGTVSSSPPG